MLHSFGHQLRLGLKDIKKQLFISYLVCSVEADRSVIVSSKGFNS